MNMHFFQMLETVTEQTRAGLEVS